MEEVFSQAWFLRKHQDGSVFGPISFDQLSGWASAAQVAPHDLVSTDQQTLVKSADACAARNGLVGRSDQRALLRTNHCRCDPGIYPAWRYQSGRLPYQFLRWNSPADRRNACALQNKRHRL